MPSIHSMNYEARLPTKDAREGNLQDCHLGEENHGEQVKVDLQANRARAKSEIKISEECLSDSTCDFPLATSSCFREG